MEMNFCRRCGTSLTNVENHIYKCENGHTIFANSSPTVGVFFVTPDNEVILSVRGIEPHKGMLDSFGGFLDGQETFEDAAVRELREELSLEPNEYEPLKYLASGIGNYPYQRETLPVLSALFWTRLLTDKPLKPSDDVAAIRTVPLHEVNMDELHDEDIRIGIRVLRQKLQA